MMDAPKKNINHKAKAQRSVNRIFNGGTAKISHFQLVSLILNMTDAQNNLSQEQYSQVVQLFENYCRDTIPQKHNKESYLQESKKIFDEFNKIAPIYLYKAKAPSN